MFGDCRYGLSGVLFRDISRAAPEKSGISLSGKAMLHILRARFAPQRIPAAAKAAENTGTLILNGPEPQKSGVISKVFSLWNKDYSAGPSRTKKKLAKV